MTNVRGSERTPGEFRRSQNWIGGASLANARFVPSPVHEMHTALDSFEKFLHDDTPMPVLIKVGSAHAHFETIHPFLDGNGRMGRLLITFLLCQQGVMKLPLLYLSHYFKLNRIEYHDRLQAIREFGDWEGWLKFFLEGVGDVAEEATITARRIVLMREEHQELVRQHFGSPGNALLLLKGLYFRPIVDVPLVAELSEISYAYANTLVRRFEQLGILRETTGYKRNRRFAYNPYLALFQDDQAEKADS
jgi:Fic family protein